MTTLIRTKAIGGLRKVERAIRDDMVAEMANGVPVRPAYLLRKDGDTDEFRMVSGKVAKTRRAGHITLGMWVDPSDLPCIIS